MLIFLYGEDSFRSRQKLLEIKQKYLQKDKSGSGLSLFCFPEDKNITQKIRDVTGISNLFSFKRLLIVENFISESSAEEQQEALDFLKENFEKLENDREAVVVFWEKEDLPKNNSLFKILAKASKSQNFENLSGLRLERWIIQRAKEIEPKAEISRAALSKLIIFTGGETQVLENELQKLISFSDEKMISEKDAEALVKAKVDANIFQTIDALASFDKKKALGFLHNHLEKGDDPFYLLSMFVYQFRNLLRVADLNEKNLPENEIVKKTKLHPFVVKKSLAQSRNFSFSKLKKIYAGILEIDFKVKTGKLDIRMGLDKFVAEL